MGKYISYASRSACAFLCLAAACSSPAISADLGYPGGGYKDYGDPIIVPSNFYSWTGFFLSGNLGYGWANANTDNRPGSGGFDDKANGFNLDPGGWLGGVSGGHNWHMDTFVFGLEGDLGYIGANDRNSNGAAFAEAEYGWYGALTARAGFAQDRFMFYAKGGLALADIKNTAGAIGAPLDYSKNRDIHAGWALGGGAEYAFNPNMTMKIEYLYMDFADETSSNAEGDLFKHDNDIHTIKVGVSYFVHTVPQLLK
ncbi:MAG: porin family protein [Hyphomicrobiales bacterium]|nr:porin family protein [Hyphomicrobiales bacterium]